MTITTHELKPLLQSAYPNANLSLLDSVYEVPDKKALTSMYDKFIKSMWKVRLYSWTKNKLDCDKWARLFTSHIIIRNALGTARNAVCLGQVSFLIDGQKGRGHMINLSVIVNDEGEYQIQEIEPQPKNGLTTLTPKERESAWRISI